MGNGPTRRIASREGIHRETRRGGSLTSTSGTLSRAASEPQPRPTQSSVDCGLALGGVGCPLQAPLPTRTAGTGAPRAPAARSAAGSPNTGNSDPSDRIHADLRSGVPVMACGTGGSGEAEAPAQRRSRTPSTAARSPAPLPACSPPSGTMVPTSPAGAVHGLPADPLAPRSLHEEAPCTIGELHALELGSGETGGGGSADGQDVTVLFRSVVLRYV